ncbi:hydrolase [Porphyromonas crevioricanis]|uniref:Exodeoxyribonuclease VII small subunit n=2 Tax=Porphyromonas crevioricanis TaxID=393921 RepID=A0A0A2FEA5_9PORP|nr:exodeoxyribonuclease VII small subunit [Porphyromonas crevioricanis]KGN89351.1 hydrolase [Porphyromonas crevioricanis]KGN93532.1 hydrolase [Porphyromonas crevioricanis]SJZ87873.1 Exodeoxyribonuclease VII small subunit [Porphyromonas crevioricanis]SQH73139.1 exodeoxyribonuclease VII small subunit [Porphyromonas crevioricanis]GAD04342.1 hydrolase [Porphyromonas crevioricanis JCM 15906]
MGTAKSEQDKYKSYTAAMGRLEEIVQRIEHQSPDVDELTALVAEAVDIVKYCRNKLTSADKKLEELISKLE